MDEWKYMWYATVNQDQQSNDSWQKLYLDYMFKLFDASGQSARFQRSFGVIQFVAQFFSVFYKLAL